MKRLREVAAIMILAIVFIVGCGRQEEKPIKVINNKQNNVSEVRKVYLESNLGNPIDFDSVDLDHFGEKGIGMRVNDEGLLEVYSVSNNVVDSYREKAEELIRKGKQIDTGKMMPKVWKYGVDKEKNWSKELVSDDALIKKVKKNRVYNYEVIFDGHNQMRVLVRESTQKGDLRVVYLFALEEAKWKEIGRYAHPVKDSAEKTTVNVFNAYVDENDNILLFNSNGDVIKYSTKEAKVVEDTKIENVMRISSINSGGKVYCIDPVKSSLLVYDSVTYAEEEEIPLPHKYEYFGVCLCADKQNNIYYLSNKYLYKKNYDSNEFDKICDLDMFNDIKPDEMIVIRLCVSDFGEVYINTYDVNKGYNEQKIIKLYPAKGK